MKARQDHRDQLIRRFFLPRFLQGPSLDLNVSPLTLELAALVAQCRPSDTGTIEWALALMARAAFCQGRGVEGPACRSWVGGGAFLLAGNHRSEFQAGEGQMFWTRAEGFSHGRLSGVLHWT